MMNRTQWGLRTLNKVVAVVLALACAAAPLAGCRGAATPTLSGSANPAPVEVTVSTDAGGELSIGGLRVVFPAGAFSSDTLVTAKRVTDPPPLMTEAMSAEGATASDFQAVGEVYDINLGGAALLQPATIVVPYGDLDIPSGHTAEELKIVQYRDGQWGVLPTVIDLAAQQVRAKADEFSLVTLCAGGAVIAVSAGLVGWAALEWVAGMKRALTDPQYLQPEKMTQEDANGLTVDRVRSVLTLNKTLTAVDRGFWVRPKAASDMLKEASPTGMCIDFSNLFGSLLIKQGYPVRVVSGMATYDTLDGPSRSGHLWVETVIDGKPYYVDTFGPEEIALVPLADAYKLHNLTAGNGFWKEQLEDGTWVTHTFPVYDPEWYKKLAPAKPAPTPPPAESGAFVVVESSGAAKSGATTPTTFTIAEPWTVVLLQTYHWNDGKGATPGTIALKSASGTLYGPWQAQGADAQGGVANGFWQVRPNVVIPAGTYTVIDSDPATWSQSTDTGGRGMTWGYGTH